MDINIIKYKPGDLLKTNEVANVINSYFIVLEVINTDYYEHTTKGIIVYGAYNLSKNKLEYLDDQILELVTDKVGEVDLEFTKLLFGIEEEEL